MPLPLLVPAVTAVAAQFSASTLIVSISASITGGMILGAGLASSGKEPQKKEPAVSESLKRLSDIVRSAFTGTRGALKHEQQLAQDSEQKLKKAVARHSVALNQFNEVIKTPLIETNTVLTATHQEAAKTKELLLTTQKDLSQAKEEIQRLTTLLAQQKETIKALHQTIAPLLHAVTEKTNALDSERATYTALHAEHHQKKEELMQMNQRYEAATNALQQQIEYLKKEVKEREDYVLKVHKQYEGFHQFSLPYQKHQSMLHAYLERLNSSKCTPEHDEKELYADAMNALTTAQILNASLEQSLKDLKDHAQEQHELITELKSNLEHSTRAQEGLCRLVEHLHREAHEQETYILQQEQRLTEAHQHSHHASNRPSVTTLGVFRPSDTVHTIEPTASLTLSP